MQAGEGQAKCGCTSSGLSPAELPAFACLLHTILWFPRSQVGSSTSTRILTQRRRDAKGRPGNTHIYIHISILFSASSRPCLPEWPEACRQVCVHISHDLHHPRLALRYLQEYSRRDGETQGVDQRTHIYIHISILLSASSRLCVHISHDLHHPRLAL